MYGYTGGSQRIVAIVKGARKVLCWGDDISNEEVEPFKLEHGNAWIEPVENPELEAIAFPTYAGRA
jgi:hypothetical protein